MSNITQSKIKDIENEIIILKQKTAQNIIDIGKRLNTAKKLIPHGKWGDWLENKVGFSARSASNYMRIAKEFDSNSQAIAALGSTKLQILLDIPKEKRDAFIEEKDVEKMSTRELRKETKEYNKPRRVEEKIHLTEEVKYNISFERIPEPKKRIDAIDKLAEENRQKIEALQKENEKLMSERNEVFRKLDDKCPVKYRWIKEGTYGYNYMFWGIDIFIECEGRENILFHCDQFFGYNEWPREFYLKDIPETYRNDFRMIWNQAYKEFQEEEQVQKEKARREWGKYEKANRISQANLFQDELKPIWKKIFNAALKVYHVDNNIKPKEVIDTFNEEELKEYNDRIKECNGMTMLINQLKETCGV